MKALDLVQVADSDKVVRLAIPVEEAERPYRLKVWIEPVAGEDAGPEEWPPGFFERTAGKWVGELQRAPQGDFEQRAKL